MHPLRRAVPAGLLLGLCLASVSAPTRGQAPDKVKSPFRLEANVSGDVRTRVNEMREGKRPFTKTDLEGYRRDLRLMAEHLVFRITREEEYAVPTATKAGELRPPPAGSGMEGLLDDIDRYVLKPGPVGRLTTEQADYIVEFGAAIDGAIKRVLALNGPPHVRVNAARALAIAARSGAPAHGPTITGILRDPKTRPEVLLYALHAAGNLLAAYNPLAPAEKFAGHTLRDPELYDLVTALEGVIDRQRLPDNWTPAAKTAAPPTPPPPAPPPAAPATAPAPKGAPPAAKGPAAPMKPDAKAPTPPPPSGQLENVPEPALSPEQLDVLRYFRRAAIRALAQCRYPIVAHPNGKDVAYPLWTLAKIAVNDARVAPPTRPDEVAEAVIGLCNYHSARGVDVNVLIDAVAAGVINYASFKTEEPEDKSIPWRVTSARMAAALDQFRKVAGNTAGLNKYAGRVGSLADVATNSVLTPIERIGGGGNAPPPDPEAVVGWRSRNPVTTLAPFIDVKDLVLKPAPRMK